MRVLIVLWLTSALAANAQKQSDSTTTRRLDEIVVKANRTLTVHELPEIDGTHIWSGKKSSVISLEQADASIADKTARQIFSKIPGVFVYDMDGTGNQVNISTRGLDPHRGWEFNIRRNDALTNSDMYGYPASHYSIPFEAVDHIQMVRGTGSLQYGAQFGGMLNYVTKRADTTRSIQLESINTIGSFGLLSFYNAIGGKIGKVEYYAYYNNRTSSGYRENSTSKSTAASASLLYRPTDKLSLKFELSHSKYLYQLPGQLTDSMFYANPRQSTRSRNYYSPDIYIPSLQTDWKLGEKTKVSLLLSAVLGQRGSVMFDKPADVQDTISSITKEFSPRQVDIDKYRSYTTEARILHNYNLLNSSNVVAMGFQLMNNDLFRRQQGEGTTGSDYDLTLTKPEWGREIHFRTKNIAFFLENRFALTKKLLVTPGFRVESGASDLSGSISYYPSEELPNKIDHQFALAGLSLQYNLNSNQNFYAGWAQAYRPVILKDIVPSSVYEKVDKDLKDAKGYNLEVGYRGASPFFNWDVSAFHLVYNNRLGILSDSDVNGDFYLYRTNIGNSITNGAEIFGEYHFPLLGNDLSVFTSTALMDASYDNAVVRVNEGNVSVDGNKVESVPEIISRNGVSYKTKNLSISLLFSYTAESYADALNTKIPSSNGSVGIVPSYGLMDVNMSYRFSEKLTVRLNVNNVTNKQYFTKRPQFYPGPGIWPSDGRSINVSIGFKTW